MTKEQKKNPQNSNQENKKTAVKDQTVEQSAGSSENKLPANERNQVTNKANQANINTANNKPIDNKVETSKSSTEKANDSQEKKTEMDKSANKVQNKKTEVSSLLDEKKGSVNPPNSPIPPSSSSSSTNGGKGLSSLALLLALGALGVSGLTYYQSTKSQDKSSELTALKSELQAELNALKTNTDNLTASQQSLTDQISQAGEKVAGFTTEIAEISERFTALEQTQKGLIEKLGQVETGSDEAIEGSLQTVQTAIQDLQQQQQALTLKLNSQPTEVAVDNTQFVYQEVAYLLHFASDQLTINQNVERTLVLLNRAKNSLLVVESQIDKSLLTAIDEKIIRLSGVTQVDKADLTKKIQGINDSLAGLQIKTAASQPVMEESKEQGGFFSNIVNSAIEYTPSSPDSINIGPEAGVLAKRFIQLDIKTAIYAIQQSDATLLTQSINGIKQTLQTAFTQNAEFNSIITALDAVADTPLVSTLPDLSGLLKQADTLANATR